MGDLESEGTARLAGGEAEVLPPQDDDSIGQRKKGQTKCLAPLIVVALVRSGDCRNEVRAIRSTQAGDIVPSRTGGERSIGAESQHVPLSRRSVIQSAHILGSVLQRSRKRARGLDPGRSWRDAGNAVDIVRTINCDNVGDCVRWQTVENGSSLSSQI